MKEKEPHMMLNHQVKKGKNDDTNYSIINNAFHISKFILFEYLRRIILIQNYNISIRRFPSNLLAGMFGFEKMNKFEAEAGAEKAPQVKF